MKNSLSINHWSKVFRNSLASWRVSLPEQSHTRRWNHWCLPDAHSASLSLDAILFSVIWFGIQDQLATRWSLRWRESPSRKVLPALRLKVRTWSARSNWTSRLPLFPLDDPLLHDALAIQAWIQAFQRMCQFPCLRIGEACTSKPSSVKSASTLTFICWLSLFWLVFSLLFWSSFSPWVLARITTVLVSISTFSSSLSTLVDW